LDELIEGRAEFAAYLRRALIGPMQGPSEVIEGTPLLRYMMGMLFPRQGELDVADDGTEEAAPKTDGEAEESIAVGKRAMPSSVGLSFLVSDEARLLGRVTAGIYEKTDSSVGRKRDKLVWQRKELPPESIELPLTNGVAQLGVLGGRGILYINSRAWGEGRRLVTVTLVNANEPKKGMDPAALLFQVGLEVRASEGVFHPYPQPVSSVASGREEAEVRYLYRDSPAFARGHGAAAMWHPGDATCKSVWADFLPTCEVRSATFEIQAGASLDTRYRDLDFLSFHADRGEIQRVLRGLADAFGAWIGEEEAIVRESGAEAGMALVRRCMDWHRRMLEGVEALSRESTFVAFQLANRAMLWQMQMAEAAKEGPFSPSEARMAPALAAGGGFKWRPFQVAFIHGVIKSLVDADSGERDVVDVIWFPTGGGKTEAYLLVAAFELVRRRLENGGNDPGTGVLSRYTLRMLTTQQFQRTGMLVCALELLRRVSAKSLGSRPFTVGLWVGQSLTPNKFSNAEELYEKWDLGNPEAKNPFLVDRCPACGTSIVDHANTSAGVVCGPSNFKFHCMSGACQFHGHRPLQVVDEALYREPPSILLGTLDKFAGLAWDNRPSAFFGGTNGAASPPSLIIQDELHLISGPLGSISAPYEVAIDGIIRARNRGVGPKVIASTATIRNSREQVRGLYGRSSTVFPSPVNRWDDAFFFRLEDPKDKPGRLYLGAMGQGTTTPVVSMVWSAAALLQASEEIQLPGSLKESYWTVLAYLNSRRELGRSITAASQEIPDRMKAIASAGDRIREIGEVMELSSQMTKDMGEAIRTLQRRGTRDAPAVGFVPCTSIISVGVDVDRLGVMLVNGQPKLTSEYIQASSRVGRSVASPGLVFTLYSSAKPRDRSHYEDFLAYHEAVYRYVEPTSVTPYAPPARERTLHAAIISLVRHATPFGANDSARMVDFSQEPVAGLVKKFKETVIAADPSEAEEANECIDAFLRLWSETASSGSQLSYVSAGRQFPTALIRDFGAAEVLGYRQTMRSVRSVDPDVTLLPVEET
jgi:hypothetical protein